MALAQDLVEGGEGEDDGGADDHQTDDRDDGDAVRATPPVVAFVVKVARVEGRVRADAGAAGVAVAAARPARGAEREDAAGDGRGGADVVRVGLHLARKAAAARQTAPLVLLRVVAVVALHVGAKGRDAGREEGERDEGEEKEACHFRCVVV